MNSAENISARVRSLAEQDRVTRLQLVEIIQELLRPYLGKSEPEHFHAVNKRIHRLLDVAEEK